MELITFDIKNFLLSFVLFIGGCLPNEYQTGEPISLAVGPTTSEEVKPGTACLIEIRKDQTIWYSITTNDEENNAIKVNEPVRKNLGKLIADYKKQCADQNRKQTYLIKGHPDSEYKPFEKVIAALKDNEEYKYNLITAPEQEEQR